MFVLFICANVKAQSFLDKITSSSVVSTVSSVVSTVTGVTSTVSDITGTWNYSNVAVTLESDNVLESAAGTLATSQVESKLADVFSKVGITANMFSFTFNSDGTFACTYKTKSFEGTYSLDSANSTVTLSYSALNTVNLGSMSANVALSGSTLSLLFEADKLLTFVSKIASISNNSTLSTVSSLISGYDGAMLGFDLTK